MAAGRHTHTAGRGPSRCWPLWLRWVLIPVTIIVGFYLLAIVAVSTASTDRCSFNGVRTVCVTIDKGHPLIGVVGIVVIVLAVAWVIRQIVRKTRRHVGL